MAELLELGEVEVTVAALTVCEPLDEVAVDALAAAGGPFAPFNVWVNCCVIVLPDSTVDDAEIVCAPVLALADFAVVA